MNRAPILAGAGQPIQYPRALRSMNLLPVLIGDSALGKPESPFAKEEEKMMKSRTWMSMTVVSLFAVLVTIAQAEIVYTPVNIILPTNGSYPIDLNHDGVTDFTFQISHTKYLWVQTLRHNILKVQPNQGGIDGDAGL